MSYRGVIFGNDFQIQFFCIYCISCADRRGIGPSLLEYRPLEPHILLYVMSMKVNRGGEPSLCVPQNKKEQPKLYFYDNPPLSMHQDSREDAVLLFSPVRVSLEPLKPFERDSISTKQSTI